MTLKNASSGEKNCVERAREILAELIETRSCGPGDHLFEQGSPPDEIFFLRSGSVHLEREGFHPSSDLCVARPGDVIGVTNAISGRVYDMSAVVTEPSVVDVVARDVFLRKMTTSPGLHLEVVRMLSIDLGRCYEVLRTLGPKTRKVSSNGVTL